MKWKLIAFYCIAMLTLVVFLPIGTTGADEVMNQEMEIDLRTTPTNVLFDVSNIKSGDVIQRSLTITNDGLMDFKYTTEALHTGGSEKLYNQLLLQVRDGTAILYEGPLSKFTGFNPRQLASSAEEQLLFKVEFPYESGNEFQGLATTFQLRFFTDSMLSNGGSHTPEESQKPSGVGSLLPKTGEWNPFIFYLTGLALVLLGVFLYRNRESFVHLLHRGRER